MVSTFTLLGDALKSQTDMITIHRDLSDISLKKQQEDWTLTISTDPSLVLDATVNNKGPNPVEIFTMVITNSTDISGVFPTTVYDIPYDTGLVTPGHSSNIVSSMPMVMSLDNTYDIKVISALGTVQKVQLVCGAVYCGPSGYSALAADMYMDPPFGIPTKNVTAVMAVTNTGHTTLTEVKPDFELPDTSWIEHPPSSSMIGPTLDSTSPVSLEPQQTAFFKWDLTVDGSVGDAWNFTNAATGLDPRLDPVTSTNSTDQLILIDPNDCGGCDGGIRQILLDDLLIRPSIFVTIPSPFGDSNYKGVWGVNIANPTTEPIEVNRVVVTTITPGSQDQDIAFDDSGGAYCAPDSVGSPNYPALYNSWSCRQENVALWHNYTHPITIPPISAQSFLFKAKPGSSGASDGEPNSLHVTANVFSSMGSFGKAGYQTIMLGGSTQQPGQIVNVYSSNVRDGYQDNEIETIRMGIDENTVEYFNIILADFDQETNHNVAAGSKVVINVPRDWTNIVIDECDGFDSIVDGDCNDASKPTITSFPDGSTQIIGTLFSPMGDIGGSVDTRTIRFHATAPEVEDDMLHIMYVFASGVTNLPDEAPIGPVSEIVLQVLDT